MLFFENHPEYESVEAMIKSNADSPYIRIILTRHDSTQIDYVNQADRIPEIKQLGMSREVFYSDIEYKRGLADDKASVLLKFSTSKGEKVVIDFRSVGTPSEKYGGLTDPGSHSINSALPNPITQ